MNNYTLPLNTLKVGLVTCHDKKNKVWKAGFNFAHQNGFVFMDIITTHIVKADDEQTALKNTWEEMADFLSKNAKYFFNLTHSDWLTIRNTDLSKLKKI